MRTIIRSSESSQAIEMCGSIGTCCTWWTRNVPSKTCGAAANAALDVAAFGFEVVHDVALSVGDVGRVVLVVDDRRAGFDRLQLVEHRRQHLVGHVDQPHRLLRDLDRLGGDRRDAVADVTNLVVEADLVVRVRVRPRLAAGGVLHPRRVAVVQHGVHAGEREPPGCRRSPRSGRGRAGCGAPSRRASRAARCRR